MKKLPFKTISSDHHVVLEVTHEGRRYEISVGVHVFSVSATGQVDPNTHLPAFHLNLSPVMHIGLAVEDASQN